MNSVTKSFAALVGVLIAIAISAVPAAAHERRDVGPFKFVVGWKVEPAFSDTSNAVQVFIRMPDGTPVTDGVVDKLQVEVIFGSQKSDKLPLKTVWRSPGEYNSPVLPTRPGTYSFHFIGTIGTQAIDETFTSSKTTFDEVQNSGEIQFPAKDPSRGEIAQRLDRLDPRLQTAQTQIDQLRANLAQTQQQAELDRNLAFGGIAVGVLAILALIALEVRRRRLLRRPEPAPIREP